MRSSVKPTRAVENTRRAMMTSDEPSAEDSVAHVFRLWLTLSKEHEIHRLLELIREELARRGCSLSYQVQPRSPVGTAPGVPMRV